MARSFRYHHKRKPYSKNELEWKVTKQNRMLKKNASDTAMKHAGYEDGFVAAMQLYAASNRLFKYKLTTVLLKHGLGLGLQPQWFVEFENACKVEGMDGDIDYSRVFALALERSVDDDALETLLVHLRASLEEASLVAQVKRFQSMAAAANQSTLSELGTLGTANALVDAVNSSSAL